MHRWVLVAVFVVLWEGSSAAAQCCGDCDGSGLVTIDELVGAVNNALTACAPPTPTSTPTASISPTAARTATRTSTPLPSCPSRFSDSGFNLCTFQGRFNLGCGNSLFGAFSSDGRNLIVQIDTMLSSPRNVFFSARVDTATSATLTGWSSDNFQTTRPTAGSVQLTNNGQQLVIFPNDPPFMILSCNFVQYNGAFVSGTANLQGSQASADQGRRFDRVSAWSKRRPPELAEPAAK